jgi:hypothetical protein
MLISVNVFLIGGIVLVAAFIGFVFRSRQLSKYRHRISELEKDILANYADILDLQKDKAVLEQRLKETSDIPVIPISTIPDEKKGDKNQDIAIRKKLLGQQSEK